MDKQPQKESSDGEEIRDSLKMVQSLQCENIYKRGKKGMDDGLEIMEEEQEDRISSLPDDLIHRILSFTDIKYAVQTSVLSSRWKLIWTTLPHLNFSSWRFRNLLVYSKFVTQVLSHRNNQTQVSSVNLTTGGALSQVFIKRILNYALSHNVQHLDIDSVPERKRPFPPCFFSSQSLKYLSLKTFRYEFCAIPTVPWDMPALTTLHLNGIFFCDGTVKCLDLFSKCVNLKNLTLKECSMKDGLDAFSISAPQLCDLKIIDCDIWRSVSFSIIAPQLASLYMTENRTSYKFVISAPHLSSFYYKGDCRLRLSTDGFQSLERVNLDIWVWVGPHTKEEDARCLMDLFQICHNAKFLTLHPDIIECLSAFPELVAHQPSPFSDLKFLEIKKPGMRNTAMLTLPENMRSYLLENSPTATFVMHLPEEPPKKRRKQVKPRARKIALEAEVRAKRKAYLELMLEQLALERAKQEAQLAELKPKFEASKARLPELSPSKAATFEAELNLLYSRWKADIEANIETKIEPLKAKIEAELKDVSSPSTSIGNSNTISISQASTSHGATASTSAPADHSKSN